MMALLVLAALIARPTYEREVAACMKRTRGWASSYGVRLDHCRWLTGLILRPAGAGT